jgi:sugar phosphate isomerase/epimerase
MAMPKICLGEDGFLKLGTMMQPRREEILNLAQHNGFQGIELHSHWETYAPEMAAPLKKYYEEFGQEIPGLQTGHLTGMYPALSDKPNVRQCYVQAVANAIRFIDALGGTHVSITPPWFTTGQTREVYTKNVKRFTEVLQEIVPYAEKYGPVLAIEPEPNLILNGGTFRDSIEDVKEVLDAINSKNLKVLFDFPHVNVLSHHDPVGFLKQLNGRVSWCHVADNDMTLTMIGTGKHLKFGEGNIDMEGLLRALMETCPGLAWLQIDTWECPDPFSVAAYNGPELARMVKKLNWA